MIWAELLVVKMNSVRIIVTKLELELLMLAGIGGMAILSRYVVIRCER
jgi:hypothetical protein